jgi:hypothetical protein
VLKLKEEVYRDGSINEVILKIRRKETSVGLINNEGKFETFSNRVALSGSQLREVAKYCDHILARGKGPA